ncbi:MAG: glycosyltransferase family 2 protein [Anaerolineales bacterium]|nr:glycosyltransferase family 2 protein [Anaerolineales bacterium]
MSAVIPAYNEAEGICRVLKALGPVTLIQEIIVVDDGSTDGTAALAEGCRQQDQRIRLIRHGQNQGKGQAFYSGYQAAACAVILTLDADLIGLTPHHVENLLSPVLSGEIDMSVAVFRGGSWNTDLGHFLTPWLSGQRCLRAELLSQIPWAAAAGYGLETAITVAAGRYGWRHVRIPWRGVFHPPSEFHRGLIRGVATRARMYAHILRAWYLARKNTRDVARAQLPFSLFLLLAL